MIKTPSLLDHSKPVSFPARRAAAVWFGAKRLQRNNEPSTHSKSLHTSVKHPQVHNLHCMTLFQYILIFFYVNILFFFFKSLLGFAVMLLHRDTVALVRYTFTLYGFLVF